jgi:hypothetical protein
MPTPAQSRAAAAHKLKRKEAGDKTYAVWLSKDAAARFDALTEKHGTQQKALEALLLGPATTVAPTPSKPVSEPEKRSSVVNKPNGLGVTVQLGPNRSAPGARQKPTKGKK